MLKVNAYKCILATTKIFHDQLQSFIFRKEEKYRENKCSIILFFSPFGWSRWLVVIDCLIIVFCFLLLPIIFDRVSSIFAILIYNQIVELSTFFLKRLFECITRSITHWKCVEFCVFLETAKQKEYIFYKVSFFSWNFTKVILHNFFTKCHFPLKFYKGTCNFVKFCIHFYAYIF